ncbi:MAG: toprim domain-containing protein [Candidatus Polarisedimenticolaceae bacterium]|nr:toprim domain-containing protein [Candidatus Polarisedimenticolaceae bacterium]
MANSLFDFIDAIRATGMEPPNFIEPGRLHRFAGAGKGPSNRAGWCLLFDDGLGGCFGDWSTGISETWQAKRDRPFPQAERAAFARRVEAAKAQAKDERQAKQNSAAIRANAIWKAATAAPGNHLYLTRKVIQTYGARLHKGVLVLPVIDIDGNITSLQFIAPDGSKKLLSGGRKQGCFIPVAGDICKASKIIICEGWATGCTLAEDEPSATVLAAIDAGNLERVALAVHHRCPNIELVIAGDDDRVTPGNPGATKARAAAVAADALLALPQWPNDAPETLTDFNDLAVWLARGKS